MATTEPATNTEPTNTTTSTKPVEESTAVNVNETKESEPITTSAKEHNAEPTKQNEVELLSEGKSQLKAEEFEKACNTLSDALRVTQQKGIATNIESVDYYIAYGEALLRYAQSSNDLFGAAVRDTQQQHLQEQQDDEDEDPVPMVTDATNTATSDSAKIQNPENKKENGSESGPDAQSNGHSKEEQDDDSDAPDPQQAAPSGGLGAGDVDTSEDREIAWETFEYARSIIEEYLAADGHQNDDSLRNKLATVHSFLGEICLEDERHEAALQEFDSALALQSQCKEGVVSCRERATNHYWACLAAQCAGKMEEALKHCSTALDCLSDKIQALCRGFEAEEECKSHDDVISVAEGVVEQLDGAQRESAEGKELKALVGVMVELSETRKEVERMILKQQQEPTKKEGMGDIMEAADPLAAMINGLIQQCGVDEEELAKMEAMAGGNGGNTNCGNNADKGQGVTTIGFGQQAAVDEDEPVHELNVVKTKRRKRNMVEAGISDDAVEEVKKMKLNTGDSAKPAEDVSS